MIVLDKSFDRLFILYNPQNEHVSIGESLLLYEPSLDSGAGPNGIIAQVIEERPYVPAGMRDSLLIESLTPEISEKTSQPEELGAAKSELRNQKTLLAKIRLSAFVEKAKLSPSKVIPWNGWSPTPSCKVEKMADSEILKFIDLRGSSRNVATIGKTADGTQFDLNLFYLHGITTIVGGRGTGKSHLAKKLALKLVDSNRQVIVFDINDEWSAMIKGLDGKDSPYARKIIKADPGESLSFDLQYLGRIVFTQVLKMMNVEESSATMQTLINAWNKLERSNNLSLESLKAEISSANEKVREALEMRITQLEGSGIISKGKRGTSIQKLLDSIKDGGIIAVNLKDKTKITQFIIVQLFISKLANILSDQNAKPLVLVVEEAQTYMGSFEIEEIVSRLRHLGLHQIYITNSPQSLSPFLLSHISNWFVFNLINDQDIQYLQRSLPLDLDSATVLTKMLPPRQSLILINEISSEGTKNYPFVVNVDPIPYQTGGMTRELFEAP
jgi:DNA helicase HerA-like ATPase